MAFSDQIQSLVGTVTETEIDQWMADGAKEIINLLPPELKMKCATRSTLNNSATTLDLDGKGDIIHITRLSADSGGFEKPCREIPALYGDLTNDSNDMMYYATVTDPIYFITNNSSGNPTLFVRPNPTFAHPSYVHHITYPTVDASSVSVIANFPDEAEYLVVLYASIKALQNKMNEKSGGLPNDIPSISLDIMTTSIPIFSVPAGVVLPSIPADADISFSSVPTAPTYVKPVFVEPLFPTINSMSLPAPIVPPVLGTPSVGSLPTSPTYTGPIVAPDFADANVWLNTEEDSEMVRSRVEIVQAQIEEFQAKTQNSLNEFNESKAVYDAGIQKLLQDAKMDDSDESRKVQKYSTDANKYQVEVNAEVTRWTKEEFEKKVTEWTTQYSNRLQEYANDIQNESGRIDTEMSIYKQEIDKASSTYQAETGYDMTRYQGEVQGNVGKYQADLSLQTESFNTSIQKYTIELKKIAQANSEKLNKYATDLKNYTSTIGKHALDYQWLQSQYVTLKQDYATGVQLLVSNDAKALAPRQRRQQPQQQRQGDR